MSALNKEKMAEIRTYKIYKHTLPDGTAYIGVTSAEDPRQRYQYSCGYNRQPFYEALEEYGWKVVETTILETLNCNWYEAHDRESYWISYYLNLGTFLYNRYQLPKEYKYNVEGCTILNVNKYFPTLKAAAAYIGVSKQAVSQALKEGRACKGFDLAYGDITNDEKTKA